jgi:hypothetical protein
MGGEVENSEQCETSKALVLVEPAISESDVIAMLRSAVGDEMLPKLKAFAVILVDLAMKGQIQHVKLVIEMLEDLAKNRAATLIRIERSVAEEWGVEPEWGDGCCIHCAKIAGEPAVAA